MRVSFVSAIGAAGFLALLAGCAASQVSSSLPADGLAGRYVIKGRIGPLELLRLQAEGKIPAPHPAEEMAEQLKLIEHHPRPRLARGHAKHVSIWASETDYSYLIGLVSSGRKAVAAINVGAEGCYYPQTIKIAASGDIWVACEYNAHFDGSAVQLYQSAGALINSYAAGCPAPVSECDYFTGYGYDGASNGTDVFAALAYSEEEVCTTSCTYVYGSGFEWWPAKSPSATPTYINLGNSCQPVCETYFADIDTSGNLWVDYSGCSNSSHCGEGLAEITDPTTDPTFNSIEPPGTYKCPGGVYVGHGGVNLSVIDACTRKIYVYTLPLSPSGSPSQTLGPTPVDYLGFGEPVSGGYNKTDSELAIGDAYGWLDLGKVSSNKWKDVDTVDLVGNVQGAAYTPSDK